MPAYMSGILPKGHSVSVDGGSVSKSAGGPPPQGSPVAKQPGVPPPEHLLRNKRKRDDEATVDGASGSSTMTPRPPDTKPPMKFVQTARQYALIKEFQNDMIPPWRRDHLSSSSSSEDERAT